MYFAERDLKKPSFSTAAATHLILINYIVLSPQTI